MNKKIFISALVGCYLLPLFVAAQQGTTTPIQFKGGKCDINKVVLQSMYAPADMKEDEKAFMVQFKYKLNNNATDEALSALFKEGLFAAPNGKSYKAGVATMNDSIYSLIVAVPKDVDVKTLKFIFDKQTASLKQK